MLGEMELKDLEADQAKVDAAALGPSEKAPAPARLVSLDALRGFDMLWITGFERVIAALAAVTGIPWLVKFAEVQLEHGPWTPPDWGRWASGFHFYDMIMPLFLFMAGASLPFSFAKRAGLGQGRLRIFVHILIRFGILFILGAIHQGRLLELNFTDPAQSRTMLHIYCNTLQAIASGTVIAAILLLTLRPAGQVLVTGALLAVYWALLRYIPAPGGLPGVEAGVRGVLAPHSNLAIWIDHWVLGKYQDGTYYTWVLTSMVFGCTVAMGSLAGQWLRAGHAPWRKAFGLIFAGVFFTIMGLVWSNWSPIVKYIWSSSFVVFSGGICLLLLGGFYLVIDVWGLKAWSFPLVVVGSNAIVAYMADQFFKFRDIADRIVGGMQKRQLVEKDVYALVQASVAFGILWFILYLMHKKKLFVRV